MNAFAALFSERNRFMAFPTKVSRLEAGLGIVPGLDGAASELEDEGGVGTTDIEGTRAEDSGRSRRGLFNKLLPRSRPLNI